MSSIELSASPSNLPNVHRVILPVQRNGQRCSLTRSLVSISCFDRKFMEIAHCIKIINILISVNERDNIGLQVRTRPNFVARGVRCLAMSGDG